MKDNGYREALEKIIVALWKDYWPYVDINPENKSTCARDIWELIPDSLKGNLDESLDFRVRKDK